LFDDEVIELPPVLKETPMSTRSLVPREYYGTLATEYGKCLDVPSKA
jgi:hypothetical protein